MLTTVLVRSKQSGLIVLPLENISSGLFIAEIEGLDPVKATLISSSFASADGAQYHSSKREPRNIVMTLGLQPYFSGNTVKSIRDRLYSFFMPKAEVNLEFITSDGLHASIVGRVETFDTPLFAKESKVIISMICFNPDFYASTSSKVSSVTGNGSTGPSINYFGSVETGFLFTIYVNRTLTSLTLSNAGNGQTPRTLDFSASLIAGDVLKINTARGNKRAELTRNNVISSVLYGVSPQSNWIELEPGNNYIRVNAVGAAVPYDIDYITKYGGL